MGRRKQRRENEAALRQIADVRTQFESMDAAFGAFLKNVCECLQARGVDVTPAQIEQMCDGVSIRENLRKLDELAEPHEQRAEFRAIDAQDADG
jgi:hypothetical protein